MLILYAEMKKCFLIIVYVLVTCTIVMLFKKTGFKAGNGIGNQKKNISISIEPLTKESLKENSSEADIPLIKEWKVPIKSSNINLSTTIEATTEEADRYTALINEQAVKSKSLWPNSEGCSHMVVTVAKDKTYPRCGLLSRPCSGNTWTRYLIESMTGIATGAVYNSSKLNRLGYIGESASVKCGCTIVQKSHSFHGRIRDLKQFNYRAIVLIRNPYKHVVSWNNYKRGGGKFKIVKKTFSLEEWRRTSLKYLREWRTYNAEWIRNLRNGIVVHYEDLQNDMMGELKRILGFLHLPFIKERYECLLKEESKIAMREKSKEQELFLRTAYTEELHEMFDAAIREINSLLKQKGHPSVPYHLYSYYNETKRNYGQHSLIN